MAIRGKHWAAEKIARSTENQVFKVTDVVKVIGTEITGEIIKIDEYGDYHIEGVTKGGYPGSRLELIESGDQT